MTGISLVVDGIIFQKSPHGGIARVFSELLPRLCDLEPGLSIDMLLDGPVAGALPQHPQIHLRQALPLRRKALASGPWRKTLYPLRRLGGRVWNHLRQLWVAGSASQANRLWHSTFFTYLPNWKGPEVVTLHDMIPERYPQLLNDPMDEAGRLQKRRCVERAAAILCDSDATRREAEAFYALDGKPVAVVPLAPSPVFHPLAAGEIQPVRVPRPFLLYVGSRVHYKNFSQLLQAYAHWQKRTAIDLLVCGPPWSSAESQWLATSGLAGNVQHAGEVSDEGLCQLYNTALALVSPSLAEGFGLPALEALACGCPLVASDIPATREVAGDCPHYFAPTSVESLLAALDAALSEGRSLPRTQAGLARAAGFSWDRTARATLGVYRQALGVDD